MSSIYSQLFVLQMLDPLYSTTVALFKHHIGAGAACARELLAGGFDNAINVCIVTLRTVVRQEQFTGASGSGDGNTGFPRAVAPPGVLPDFRWREVRVENQV